MDPVNEESSPEYIRGSHQWGEFNLQHFGDHSPYEGTDLPALPDIEADRETYDIARFGLEPGDCLLFQAMISTVRPAMRRQFIGAALIRRAGWVMMRGFANAAERLRFQASRRNSMTGTSSRARCSLPYSAQPDPDPDKEGIAEPIRHHGFAALLSSADDPPWMFTVIPVLRRSAPRITTRSPGLRSPIISMWLPAPSPVIT